MDTDLVSPTNSLCTSHSNEVHASLFRLSRSDIAGHQIRAGLQGQVPRHQVPPPNHPLLYAFPSSSSSTSSTHPPPPLCRLHGKPQPPYRRGSQFEDIDPTRYFGPHATEQHLQCHSWAVPTPKPLRAVSTRCLHLQQRRSKPDLHPQHTHSTTATSCLAPSILHPVQISRLLIRY